MVKRKNTSRKDPTPEPLLSILLTGVSSAAGVTAVILSLRERAAKNLQYSRSNRRKVVAWATAIRTLYTEVVGLEEFANTVLKENDSQFRVGGRLFLTDSKRQVLVEITRRIFRLAEKCFDTSVALQDALLKDVEGFSMYAAKQLEEATTKLRGASERSLHEARSMWEIRDGLKLIEQSKHTLAMLSELEPMLLKFTDEA